MKTICLNMIVRNEAAVIKRCLDSVKEIIDYWVICDTGSTDNTKEIIAECLKGVPGELHEMPWRNFSHNRNECLKHSQNKADYLLFLDADMIANVYGDFKSKLEADSYLIRYEGVLDYSQQMLVRNTHDWRYVGVTHEYITSDTARTREKLPELTLTHFCDGGMRAEKFLRDIDLLTKGLDDEPHNARYMFYLAQSYRDIGEYEKAIASYTRRIAMGGWDEEVWHSMYQIGKMQQKLATPWPTVLNSYLEAYSYRPTRLEPLYQITLHYRQTREYHLGYLFAKMGMEIGYPDDILFIEKDVYEYKLSLEYAICCYWVGKHAEAIRVNNDILSCQNLPREYADTAIKNRRFSLDKVFPKASRPVPSSWQASG